MSASVLGAFGRDGTVTIDSIAAHTRKPREAVSQVLHRLKRGGYIKRVNGAGPGALGEYQLTAKGQRVVK